MLSVPNSPGKGRLKISELFDDERCSKAILDFQATTEVGRTAGPPVADEEPGSLGVGEERARGISCTGGGGREGAGRGSGRLGGGGFIDYLFFIFFLFISYVKHLKAEEGGRGGHIVAGTLGGSVVAGKGFVICCHDLYRSNAEKMKPKKST